MEVPLGDTYGCEFVIENHFRVDGFAKFQRRIENNI